MVTILIPVYNAEKYLSACLESIIGQTYKDLQVVMVDDGSKDGSLALAQKYCAQYPWMEVYHQENQGVAVARNELLKHVKGDYVLFVDADDWIELEMVEYLVGLAAEHNSEFVMCDRVMNDAPLAPAPYSVRDLSKEKAIEDFIHHGYFVGSLCNKLLSSSLLHNEQFHCGISYGEDALFCWAVLQKVNKVTVTSRQLYHYREVESSISHQTFGAKKLSGHQTWAILTEEVRQKWPQHYDLVRGVYACSEMYLLQAASQSGYPYGEDIKLLQRTIRDNYRYMRRVAHGKKLFYATMIMWWYGFGKVYYKLHLLRR